MIKSIALFLALSPRKGAIGTMHWETLRNHLQRSMTTTDVFSKDKRTISDSTFCAQHGANTWIDG